MAMVSIGKINLEYLLTAIFGIIALVLSLITGLFAGVGFGTVAIRALIIMIMFAGIGFGVGIVLKKYVPELYSLLITFFTGSPAVEKTDEQAAASIKDEKEFAHEEAAAENEAGSVPDLPEAEETVAVPFKELDKEVLAHYSTGSGDTGINTKEGKLGKHVLAKEKLVKYEPKVMAQAVRTMMSNE